MPSPAYDTFNMPNINWIETIKGAKLMTNIKLKHYGVRKQFLPGSDATWSRPTWNHKRSKWKQ